MMRRLSLLLLAAGLAACSSVGDTLSDVGAASDANAGVCPNVFVLKDAARAITFAGEPAVENVAWTAEVIDVRASCRYVDDRPIRAKVEIDFAVGKGPAADGMTYQLPYFVAVTRTNRDLIAKEEFTAPVQIKGGIATVSFSENIDEILIPRRDGTVSGTNFEIAVGIALTRDQILYNRSGSSLKFPEL